MKLEEGGRVIMFPVIYRGHTRPITAVAWSPDNRYIASGDDSSKVCIWEAFNGAPLSSYSVYRGEMGPREIVNLAWSFDGKYVVSGSTTAKNQVEFHEVRTGKLLYTYPGQVWSAVWSPDRKLFASASKGDSPCAVQIWQAAGGHTVHTYPEKLGKGNHILDLAWSPNSKYIVSGNSDNTVEMWNAITEQTVFTLRGHTMSVLAVAWSPDGKYIASGSADKTVKVWQAATGTNITTYGGHGDYHNYSDYAGTRYLPELVGRVFSVAWSPDSKYIASAAFCDNKIRVWDAFTGKEIFIYSGHTSSANTVNWSPRGLLASGANDNTVHIWPILQGF